MIDLGLTRISKLVRLLQYPFPWRAIHVAGTNGKGSVCAYLSTALTTSHLHTGRFTSPHLLDRWDCITINNTPISRSLFLSAESHIQHLNRVHSLNCTEFELLTATAFEVFTRAKVDVAVVEVGMGGRGDATNVFVDPLVVVVTKVGMDHEGFLGGTLGEIAWQKAGIIKNGVKVVVDGSNESVILDVVEGVAREVEAGEMRKVIPPPTPSPRGDVGEITIPTPELGPITTTPSLPGTFQHTNSALAIHALSITSLTYPQITPQTISAGISSTTWPGRLDHVDLSPLLPSIQNQKTLLDGAHNPQAASALATYIDSLRPPWEEGGVNWVLAFTQGKAISAILKLLLRNGDKVFAVPFGEVDGMPWVRCMPPAEIVREAREAVGCGEAYECVSEAQGLEEAWKEGGGKGGMVVVAGSLYLVGSILRKLREKTEAQTQTDTETEAEPVHTSG